MILAIDVYYKANLAKAVGVIFNWTDEAPTAILQETITGIADYVPGEFYKRELPCIMQLLQQTIWQNLQAIVVDGYVYLDDNKAYGLGAHLWKALGEKIPVIGIAKTRYHNNAGTVCEVLRGTGSRPLFVSAIGINLQQAARHIQNMAGHNRMPAILKTLDTATKQC